MYNERKILYTARGSQAKAVCFCLLQNKIEQMDFKNITREKSTTNLKNCSEQVEL